ncbi:MAG: 50S ribosomal protein L25 [Spirochaetes bacterium]|nr:50S ribosomal protein L25 [Spirochaetota bacterium]
MESKSLPVEPRTDFGKNASRRLRREGFIPGLIYSHGETETVKVSAKDFFKLFKGKVSESVLFDIKGGTGKEGEGKMGYVKDYQLDPLTGEIVHLDLFKVTKGEKLITKVPIEFTGTAKGVKMGGIFEIDLREVEVECLPKDLPEVITVDITELTPGDSVHVSDISPGEGVTILAPPESPVASVQIPRVVVSEEKPEEAEGAEEEEKKEAPSEASGE